MTAWYAYGMLTFHPYRWYQLRVIPLDSRVCTWNHFDRPIIAERVASDSLLYNGFDLTLLESHSQGGSTISTMHYCSALSKLIVTIIVQLIN